MLVNEVAICFATSFSSVCRVSVFCFEASARSFAWAIPAPTWVIARRDWSAAPEASSAPLEICPIALLSSPAAEAAS
ncbi:MAG: hypothetical protein ACJ8AI_21085 [Rhodopila sp.]